MKSEWRERKNGKSAIKMQTNSTAYAEMTKAPYQN